MSDIQTGTIQTHIPARLDRLPWSRFHWRIVVGLGSVWILDGLEVTMVGSVASRLTEKGSGLELTPGQVGLAAAIYIIGACLGALVFGQLTDRLGRKKLFIVTLAIYIAATVATAFSFSPLYFYAARFVTGAGIGGEYAAINSAIDELIPARARGRVDLSINGSYWFGSAAGAAVALLLLNPAVLPIDVGWRVCFGLGAVLGLLILLVRRNVPESPRWLFIHGRQDEAERIVSAIEDEIRAETNQQLEKPDGEPLTVRQRKAIPFREIARVAFKTYPKRSILGLALFVGQAFIYNGVTFNLGTLLSTFYGVAAAAVPLFFVIWALSNFAGPLTLGRFFDTVGRIPMIAGTYLGSAVIVVGLAIYLVSGHGNPWIFLVILMAAFFLASSGASAAYLTVSEVFPMETRALAIAFFYAIGTAIGGITGPLLFGRLIGSDDAGTVAIAFYVGAGVMALGGVVELVFGVKAEQATLEDIAKPLTSEEPEESKPAEEAAEPDSATADHDEEGADHDDKAADHDDKAADHDDKAADHDDKAMPAGAPPRPQPGSTSSTAGARRSHRGHRQVIYSPWMRVSPVDDDDKILDHEVETIANALRSRGPMTYRELSEAIGGHYWGPGRFRAAVRAAIDEGVATRAGRSRLGPPRESP